MTAGQFPDVTCPFCGLVCDDLAVEAAGDLLTVRANGCALASAGFGRLPAANEAQCRVGGRPARLEDAIRAAAGILREARLPIIGGLATDVAGARAAAELADRCRGVLDHMNSPAMIRNLLVLQDGGWITTTLSEIRNRADLLLAVGGDVVSRFPRFFERCIAQEETLFGNGRRCEVIFLGHGLPAGVTLPGITSTVLRCENDLLHEAWGVLRALVAGRTLAATEVAGHPIRVWEELAVRLRAARYGVATWAAADFDFPHAELTIQGLCELIKDLGRETRFSGLPLGGSDGDLSAENVALWQTGFGGRTSFAGDAPDHDPHLFSTARLLADGADALVWIASFNERRTPPATEVPAIVLGRAGMTLEREPEVFIPVGTPGVEHPGHLFRADRVVALPLAGLRASSLPRVADVLAGITALLPAA